MSESTSGQQVKSALRTLDIIEYAVAAERPFIAQDVASALSIPVSSLSYLLTTLVDRGYLSRTGRNYTTGPGLQRLQLRKSLFSLADRVEPLVTSIRMQLNETASFFVQRGWEVETLATATSDQALRYAVSVGARTPLHSLSAGKAVLAALSDADLDRYFAETERTRFTPHTLVDEAPLRAEIARVRELGYARTREEHTLGIQGVSRAVRVDSQTLGAFSVAIPNVRFNEAQETRAVALLRRTCALLELD